MTSEDFGGFECQFGCKFVKFRCSFESRYFGSVLVFGRLFKGFLKANLVVNSSNCVVVLNPNILCVQPDAPGVHEQIDDFCF
jgi:hypothetical protein